MSHDHTTHGADLAQAADRLDRHRASSSSSRSSSAFAPTRSRSIGDALHNVTDTLALLLALFAVRLERRPATSAKSYGWHRAGVLAAFINAGTLAAFTIFLFVEAAQRLRAPATVNSTAMLITAAAALVLNGAITLWLRGDGKHDLNIRGAVLHMLGDAISSAGIIAAALLIRAHRRAVLGSGGLDRHRRPDPLEQLGRSCAKRSTCCSKGRRQGSIPRR